MMVVGRAASRAAHLVETMDLMSVVLMVERTVVERVG